MIKIKTNTTPKINQVRELYSKAGLNRPSDDRGLELMLKNANIKISAWNGEQLVGFLRGSTDFCFDCYINDLAVDPDFQGKGIGRRLIEQLESLIEEDTLIFLISAPDAVPFYKRMDFKHFKTIEDTLYLVNKKQDAEI